MRSDRLVLTPMFDLATNKGELGKVESYIGSAKQWTQKFTYDHIGRLKNTEEWKPGTTPELTYKQTFDFDRFGNMYRKAASNSTTGQANPLAYTPIEDSHISESSNRLTSATSYDEAGKKKNGVRPAILRYLGTMIKFYAYGEEVLSRA